MTSDRIQWRWVEFCYLCSQRLKKILFISYIWKKQSVRSNMWTVIPFSMSEKDLVCPNYMSVQFTKRKTWCPAASNHILQHASQHAFLTTLTHSPHRESKNRCQLTEAAFQNYYSFIPYSVLWTTNLQTFKVQGAMLWQSSISQMYTYCM